MEINTFSTHAILNAANAPILVIRDRTIEFANTAAHNLVGYDPEGMPLLDLVHPDHHTWLDRWTDDSLLPAPTQLQFQTTNSEPVWVQVTIAPIQWEEKAAYLLTAVDIGPHKSIESTLFKSEKSVRVFQKRLKSLHAISLQLAQVDTLDELYRQAIELGRSELKFDRLGMWLIDTQDPHFVQGTFGTDERGNTRDERHVRLPISTMRYPTIELSGGESRLYINRDTALYNDKNEVVGQGWVAMAYLSEGERVIGSISTDNLLRHEPPEPYHFELLGLYGATLSNLITRKRIEENLRQNEETARQFQQRLKGLHAITIELARAETLNELCRQAVELGRSELKFDRLGLWLATGEPDQYVGTFGTDEQGQLRDESQQKWKFLKAQFSPVELEDDSRLLYFSEHSPLRSDRGEIVGQGWSAMVYMYEGGQIVGAISADNLLRHEPLERYQLQLLSLYGATLGHLVAGKRSEEQQRAAEERFSKAFHINPSPLAISTLDEGIFVDANESFLQMFGYTHDEVIGHTSIELGIWDAESYNELIQTLKTHGRVRPFETQQHSRTGEVRTVLFSAELIEVRGKPHILGMGQDLTERRHFEQMLVEQERLKAALHQEEELNALKNTIVIRISHEFRTPLSVILNSAQILERYQERLSEDRKRGYLIRIEDQVDHLTRMLDDILITARAMSNRVEFAPSSFDLDMLCRSVVAVFQNRLRTEQKLDLTITGELRHFVGDERLIRLMLENLLSNALKFSVGSTPIHMSLSASETEVQVQVRDEGIGILPEERDHIFEPFFRGSNIGEMRGLGIGLRIVQDAVTLHRGSIQVDSQIGQGTTVTICLPLVKDSPPVYVDRVQSL